MKECEAVFVKLELEEAEVEQELGFLTGANREMGEEIATMQSSKGKLEAYSFEVKAHNDDLQRELKFIMKRQEEA